MPESKRHHPEEKHLEEDDMHGTLLEWKAPGRPFRVHSRQYYMNVLLITAAIEIILFLFAQYLLMVVVLAFVFLAFALATTPPREFYYRITTEGVLVEDHFFI